GHDSAVSALVISPDGRWVATASKDSTVILWDARDACISQEWFAHDGKVWDLAFSQDSRHLASAGKDEKVAIWDISGTSHQVVALEGHSSIVEGCAWSSDGAYIASRDSDNIVRVWDGRTFQPLPVDSEMAHIKPLFSPDSHRLLVPHGGSCGVLDFVSDACLALDMPTRGEDVYPISAAFSRLGTHIAVGYDNGVVRVWDAANRQQCLLLRAHEDPVTDVVFSPDGRLLLSASDDRTMKVWDAHTGAMVRSLDGHEIGVRGACFSPCGTYIASAAETVRIWRTSDGSCLAVLSDHDDPWVSHVAFTPDGTMLWSGAFNGTVLGRRLQDVIPDEFKV
ncbi:WD40 repeat-like protein, partial [Dichomitus squalens LYAD-421 SS1]